MVCLFVDSSGVAPIECGPRRVRTISMFSPAPAAALSADDPKVSLG